MHFTIPSSLLLSATLGNYLALSQPTATPETDTVILQHTPDGTALFPTNSSATPEAPSIQSTKCITFYSDNPNWHYANTGIWGSATGRIGARGRKICVPQNNGPGGAMYIGTEAKPGPGNTKLEIKFPTSGTAYGDVSLVDGYSLSVQCLASTGQVIGGSGNLWKTGKPCVDKSLLSRGIYKNAKGYAPSQSDVTAFFQEGVKFGDKNCIWQYCPVPGWPVSADYYCHVSGGR